jgi:regulatory protein
VPQITALKEQANNPNRVNLYLDGRFCVGLSYQLVIDLKLVVGQQLSPPEIKSLQKESGQEKLLNQAYRYLSYRPRSEKEVSDYLLSKEASLPQIDLIITKLKEQDYLNDEEFALWWLEQRQKFKPRGRLALSVELTVKGIDKKIIDEILSNLDEGALIARLIKQYLDRRPIDNRREKERLVAYLKRRGFSWETIKAGLADFNL